MAKDSAAPKAVYQKYRVFPLAKLWSEDVPRFNQATAEERLADLGLIRAVGVVAAETGSMEEQRSVREWMKGLLQDPEERIRRYAINALPKLGSGQEEEKAVLALIGQAEGGNESKFIAKALDKIGGEATLEFLGKNGEALPLRTLQKVTANSARSQSATVVRMDAAVSVMEGLQVRLRGRRGLESWMVQEVQTSARTRRSFRIERIRPGNVTLVPLRPFTLGDLYSLRCFGTVALVLGQVPSLSGRDLPEKLARMIASDVSRRVLAVLTEGPIRYRLELIDQGSQGALVREVVTRAFALSRELLNDSRQAPWAIDVHPYLQGGTVELRPRLSPDPRFAYRQDDVPAASHPPLAAAMARLAGPRVGEVVWDPFCGSGLELIERSLLGGVKQVFGSDLSEEAVRIATANWKAAGIAGATGVFTGCDFRDWPALSGQRERTITLMISNPPMGRRVPVSNLRGLIGDMFETAERMLVPGGRLVMANPFRAMTVPRSLRRTYRKTVDLGGFDVELEKYEKGGKGTTPRR